MPISGTTTTQVLELVPTSSSLVCGTNSTGVPRPTHEAFLDSGVYVDHVSLGEIHPGSSLTRALCSRSLVVVSFKGQLCEFRAPYL